MHFHIITLFRGLFDGYLGESIIARAKERGLIDFHFYNIRDFAQNKWKKVDERPYGGGPGMVLTADPIIRAAKKAIGGKKKVKVIILSPGGVQFTNEYATKLVKNYKHIVFIVGRYEGIDARVKKILKAEEVSVGPYVVSGGEAPALIIMDAVMRQLPGVLGKDASVEERRVSSHEIYTRPEVYVHNGKKYKVPKVLLSGHHKKIDSWKKTEEWSSTPKEVVPAKSSLGRTPRTRRP